MGEGALLAKHCFASARTHSRQRLGRTAERGLRRPPQPDPPRLPTGNRFCFCCCLGSCRGRGLCRCRAQPCRTPPRRGVANACDGSSHGQPWTRLYTSGVTRLSRPQRLLLQLAILATLLMVLAPLVSRALQAPPMDHAAMAGMDHAHMHHDAAAVGQSPLHGQRSPTPPADPHAMHGEACEYCVLAMRLLPWLAVLVLLLPLLWRPRLVFPWSQQVLPALRWPAHAARGPPRASIVR